MNFIKALKVLYSILILLVIMVVPETVICYFAFSYLIHDWVWRIIFVLPSWLIVAHITYRTIPRIAVFVSRVIEEVSPI